MIIFIIGLILFSVLLPFIGWWSLLAFGIVLLIGWGIWLAVPECPRVIMGWDCKGKNCDHSPETLNAAKITMLRK